jgi:PPOX class probable F420-dependent enzyme
LTDELRALVEGRSFAYVASTRADGSPDVVPVWVTTVGDRLAFFTQTTTSKSRNLERDPRVAIAIADAENPYRPPTSGAESSSGVPTRRSGTTSSTRCR